MRGQNMGKRTTLGLLTQSQRCVGWSGGGYLVWAIFMQLDA